MYTLTFTLDEIKEISLNFFTNLSELYRKALIGAGYQMPCGIDPGQTILTYFNVQWRRISPQRRRVWYSTDFRCPGEHLKGLHLLSNEIKKGRDINAYQSKFLRKGQYRDKLLNAWGIHHFHLGVGLRADGLIERTGPLLYARVDPSDVYFLTVTEHGKWTMQELVRIIHRDWPEVISRYRMRGVARSTNKRHILTDEQIANARRYNVNTFVQMLDGTVYMEPGGGYASDASNLTVVMRRDMISRQCNQFANLLRDNILLLVDICAKKGVDFLPPYKFQLQIIDGMVTVYEENYNVRLGLLIPFRIEKIV